MKVIEQIKELREAITVLKKDAPFSKVGFVPTMGALHEGHLSLIEHARQSVDIVVCSIFVNPTQFNDPKDLSKYPRTVKADIQKLVDANCDVLFLPNEKVVYPEGPQPYKIDFNGLDKVMEGKFRDDHFNGVAMVVHRLFDIVQPDLAFFGLKDFQQVAIIKHMVKVKDIDVQIVPVPIVRSSDGLALSSRNILLTEEQREQALIIYQTLLFGKKQKLSEASSVAELKEMMVDHFNKGALKLEYLEIVDNDTLLPAQNFQGEITACIAAYCGSVRLIDNMRMM